MFARTFTDGERFPCAGNEYVMLVPREVTNCCEVVLEKIEAGGSTPPNAHLTFNQAFIILEGVAEVTIGDEKRHLSAPAVAYVPKNTQHFVRNVGTADLQYVYITIWSDGIPADERQGGWRQACGEMVREYAERGYPPSPHQT
jgi:mannose-6-phosphate isomerase-like protein (cupin superfamily)